MNVTILYHEVARKTLAKGISTLANAVAVTMGPKGRNVVLAKAHETPQIINDGVTIAKEISLNSWTENAGASLIKEAALKTNQSAGDGTTTATILAYSLIYEGLKYISAGINGMKLKSGILKSVRFINDMILEHSRPISNSSDILQIATISANNDIIIGQFIQKAFIRIGREGLISLEEGHSTNTQLHITEGMQFDKGFLSPYFLDKNLIHPHSITKKNPYILLSDEVITSASKEIIPVLELIVRSNRPLVIISRDIDQNPLSTLIVNYLKQKVDVVAIKAPGFGKEVNYFLEDIAILTNTIVINKDRGIKFNQLTLDKLGQAETIIVNKTSTTIISDQNHSKVQLRCSNLRKQIEKSDSLYEKDKLEKRLAKLAGGVAVIRVGANTATEMKEKMLRYEDALNAAKAAITEGILIGGGCALAHMSLELKEWAQLHLEDDEKLGAELVVKSLVAPLIRIVSNSGKNGNCVLSQLLTYPRNIGYDALQERFEDLFNIGVIDPSKVTRCALQNAASVASMILTTECVIPEQEV
uniref:chaperonin GroEL n=1 Tax=Chroothece richteriana TaxID=101928 RepID=UPI001FCD1C58|nr:chaperonin GroEL [Chroothece richteriana]UNJ14114.1 chaperonin GroEL [Chroothece richteriana]